MKVVIQPEPGHGGCPSYRLEFPANHLAAQGYDVTCVEGLTLTQMQPVDERQAANHVEWAASPGARVNVEADVVVFQRAMQRQVTQAIPVLQRQGVAVVVEIDDNFHRLPKRHPSRRHTSAMANTESNRYWLGKACEKADLVTVSTPALLEQYASHGRGMLLRNCVPESYLAIDAEPHEDTVIGWTGWTVTHVDDLRVCGDGIYKAIRDSVAALEAPVRFGVVGSGVGVKTELGLDEVEACGWVDMAEYPHRYARFDVAIAPLQLSPFNEAKSWLKVLEAAALGVPVVASPTSEYQLAADLGMCVLAGTPGAWREQVAGLAINRTGRMWQAQRAREAAAEFTVEGNAWRWQEAWAQAVEFHRARKQAA